MTRPRVLLALTCCLLAGAACSPGDDTGAGGPPSAGPSAAQIPDDPLEDLSDGVEQHPAPTPEVVGPAPVTGDPPVTDPSGLVRVAPACRPGPGRSVTQLPDVRVPAVDIPAVQRPAVTIDGAAVPGAVAAGTRIAEQLIDGGCIVEYDAPAGCLGRVEITGATIEAEVIPERTLAATALPDGQVVERAVSGRRSVTANRSTGASWAGGCPLQLRDLATAVSRPELFRPSLFRPGLFQAPAEQPAACGTDGCTPAVTLPSVTLPDVELPSAVVEPTELAERPVTDDAWVVSGSHRKSWVAAGDALFDTGSATVRSDAARLLTVVAADLRSTSPAGPVLVDGHTDDVGSDADNLALSQRRAAAVGAWLTSHGGVAAGRLRLAGHGEREPVTADRSSAGRQRNRRVVVSVPLS